SRSQFDLALEDGFGGTGQGDRFARPVDSQLAAARAHLDFRPEEAAPDAGDHRGAGTRAAGQGLADAALPYPQPGLAAIDHFQEAYVDPFREPGRGLEPRAH